MFRKTQTFHLGPLCYNNISFSLPRHKPQPAPSPPICFCFFFFLGGVLGGRNQHSRVTVKTILV